MYHRTHISQEVGKEIDKSCNFASIANSAVYYPGPSGRSVTFIELVYPCKRRCKNISIDVCASILCTCVLLHAKFHAGQVLGTCGALLQVKTNFFKNMHPKRTSYLGSKEATKYYFL